jgi:hypothetical protein
MTVLNRTHWIRGAAWLVGFMIPIAFGTQTASAQVADTETYVVGECQINTKFKRINTYNSRTSGPRNRSGEMAIRRWTLQYIYVLLDHWAIEPVNLHSLIAQRSLKIRFPSGQFTPRSNP